MLYHTSTMMSNILNAAQYHEYIVAYRLSYANRGLLVKSVGSHAQTTLLKPGLYRRGDRAFTNTPLQANSATMYNHAKADRQCKKPMKVRMVWRGLSNQYGYPAAPFGLPFVNAEMRPV
ncbi:hypothetical protein AVEN_92007-1 [Araneus ventricosus]|uniref:Uncharacterized protein n=1 Tax=Araneus ventricosus TaxID=182803 RepID=A0A4Y2FL91_ARAVE|nr:hypothetical protein AVEN_92007-1 [Araneus ventricosus]